MDRMPQLLLHLGNMAVTCRLVRANTTASFRMVGSLTGTVAAFGRAAFGFRNHRLGGIHDPLLEQRPQRQNGGRRIASGTADISGLFHFFPVQFNISVDKFTEPVRLGMVQTVPFAVCRGIFKSKISRQIDHAVGKRTEFFKLLHAAGVGQGGKQQVHFF